MSSLIELAAQRLEQLKGTGLTPPVSGPAARAPVTAVPEAPTVGAPLPLVEAAMAAAVPAARAPLSSDAPSGLATPGRTSTRRIVLNLAELATHGFVTPDQPRTQLAHQYRVIKRPLLRNVQTIRESRQPNGNLIMVTSALPGEGKSFTAVNLALSIASEFDHTVMLVDADVARPSVPRMLGFDVDRGLLDVLEGKAEVHDVLMRTNIDKLTILPSGRPHAHATELLASQSMQQLVHEIATRYEDRIVIFDSPPLLLTTESRVLAAHMGQIALVVQADRTPQSSVQRALATIEGHPLRQLVLNQMRGDPERGGEYYGYGYGYGYGDDSRAPSAPASSADAAA